MKTIAYIHTPPRGFCDQWQSNLDKLRSRLPFFVKPFFQVFKLILELFRKVVLSQFSQSLNSIDHIITNSQNIKKRTQKYLQIEVDSVIYPAVDTTKFHFLGQDSAHYYHSHCRLEELKRIPLIIKIFEQMPGKNLVITSGGPLENWIKSQIKTKNLTNIDFRGRVSDEELFEIMGNCTAGIMIPVDEDAGITQIEFLAAGKPVIGVAEGGLLETITENLTGILIPSNPTLEDLKMGINRMTPEFALSLRENCQKEATKYDNSVFFDKLDKVIEKLLE